MCFLNCILTMARTYLLLITFLCLKIIRCYNDRVSGIWQLVMAQVFKTSWYMCQFSQPPELKLRTIKHHNNIYEAINKITVHNIKFVAYQLPNPFHLFLVHPKGSGKRLLIAIRNSINNILFFFFILNFHVCFLLQFVTLDVPTIFYQL